MTQLPFKNEWLHANAIGHAPKVCGSHDNARYPFKGRSVVNVGNGSSAVQSAPSGHATHDHSDCSWSVSFKYSPTLQAPQGGNSHPVNFSLDTFPDGQSAQFPMAPRRSTYVFGKKHLEHSPGALPYVPKSQPVHVAAPVVKVVRPGSHRWHWVASSSDFRANPTGQFLQPCPNVPAPQAVHLALPS